MLVYIKPLSMFPKIHSDKLFGAFLSAISEIFPSKMDELIEKFNLNEPPFLISSTFPVLYINGTKKRFFPKIIINDKLDERIPQKNIKDFNKVEYIEDKIFFEIINGNLSHNNLLLNYNHYVRINDLFMSKDYGENIELTSIITPHNSVNRMSNETKIFYTDGQIYGDNIGLFFFIKFLDETYQPIIKSCLKFLKDRGFGRDISSGNGQFDYEIVDSKFNFDDKVKLGNKFITLSRFIPNDEDLVYIGDNACYEIQSKRSIDKSGDIRKKVHFFKEGSIFLHYKKFYGQIVPVGNYKPAIEYGYAFPIKFDEGCD